MPASNTENEDTLPSPATTTTRSRMSDVPALNPFARLYCTYISLALNNTNSLVLVLANSKSTKDTKRPLQLPPGGSFAAFSLYHPRSQFLLGLKHLNGPSTTFWLRKKDILR